MPTITDTAICVRRWDFSETSQTVSLFTREHGIVRGIAKGAKRERGAFSGGLDILTRGQVVAIVRPGRDLATLTSWSLEATYRALRQRLDANRAGLYMADLVHHLLTELDPHARLFDVFAAALERLSEPGAEGPALLEFQWRLLEETGFRPEVERDVETGQPLAGASGRVTLGFSARLGGVVDEEEGRDRWRVRRATVDALRGLAAGEAPEGFAPEDVERANRLLAAYVREIVSAELPALRWAFPDL